MKKLLPLIVLVLISIAAPAHDSHYENVNLRHWHLENNKTAVEGSFTLYKEGVVYLQDEHGGTISIPFGSLSRDDQQFVQDKIQQIGQLNGETKTQPVMPVGKQGDKDESLPLILGLVMLGMSVVVLNNIDRKRYRLILPVFFAGVCLTILGFGKKYSVMSVAPTNPAFIDSAFTPFKPNVNTFWDTTYFYVESKGIPTTHGMMVGISDHGWQQQVPIPQCYIGTNAWPIPLNPVMSANPIPVDSIHFTRGAIAIAANGVPIFNVHTNTGVDAFLSGQLDNYGGHCGRADDYHYHTAPLHLYAHTSTSLPCAFGLDGFPVYGSVEPDGNSMQVLDSNHGHFYNGLYHYHGTPAAPYMIARMAGVVTEDTTHQLIPQASAQRVRPALTPLNGALITGCTPNLSNNGYTLTYVLNGQTDSIVYFWNANGQYTYRFYTAGNGTFTTQNYNGFTQCLVPTGLSSQGNIEGSFRIYPNPNAGRFTLPLYGKLVGEDIIGLVVFDLKGRKIYESQVYEPVIDLDNVESGVYIVHIKTTSAGFTQKFIIRD